jgi:hypothetical protein
MIRIERVAGAAQVRVPGRILRIEQVERAIVDAAKRLRGPQLVPFVRVVEHDIEDHFDAGLVEGFDQIAELVHVRDASGSRSSRSAG